MNEEIKLDSYDELVDRIVDNSRKKLFDDEITKDNIQNAIENNFENNRLITDGLEFSMLESIVEEIASYVKEENKYE